MIAVTDTGAGMDRATRERAFDPFFTTKEVGKGTGLGLSQAYGFARQSAGHVKIYSEIGEGTTVKIYLPRHLGAADEASANAAGEPARSVGAENILVVEDDDALRAYATEILRELGYRVLEASSGAAALDVLAGDHKIDLLLSDVVMPQMSGPELAKRLASARPDMKVLCMSGYTDDSIVRHGVLEAHIAYLQKPITPEALTTRVREVLDGSSNGTTRREG